MPFETKWIVEPYVLLFRQEGVTGSEEFTQSLQAVLDIMNNQIHPVHFVVDLSNVERFSANITKIPAAYEVVRHPHFGWVGIVGSTALISFWMQLLARTSNFRFKLFPTVEDATEFMLEIVRNASDKI